MKKIRLDCGLNLEVHDEVIKDYRFFEDLSDLNEGNPFAIRRVLNRLLDPDEKEKLMKHFEKDGFVPTEKITEVVSELFVKLGSEAKN